VSVERRRAVRRAPAATEPLSRARLRTGPELVITEISDVGASARSQARLLPGTHVDVHLMTRSGRVLRRARVARAAVGSIDGTGIVFQVALAFDAPVDSSVGRVSATRIEEFANPLDGERLPAHVASRVRSSDGTTPIGPSGPPALALELEREAGCTAKE